MECISKITIVFSDDYSRLSTPFLTKRRKRQKRWSCQKLCIKIKSSQVISRGLEVKKSVAKVPHLGRKKHFEKCRVSEGKARAKETHSFETIQTMCYVVLLVEGQHPYEVEFNMEPIVIRITVREVGFAIRDPTDTVAFLC